MGMDAIDAGKHIYMEKTIAHTIPEAIKLSQKLKNSPLVFQVGHQYRYYGLYHKVKEILDGGWCGQVTQFECQYHRNNDWKKPVADPKLEKEVNWRMYKAYSGGLMTELCAHQIDIVNWFTGNVPTKVTGMGSLDYWKDGREIFDHTRALYHYPNGVTSSVSSILSNAYKGYAIRILGTEGTVEIQRDKAFVYAEPKKVELGVVDGVSGATIKNNTHGEAIPIHFDSPDGRNQEPTLYALADFAKCILERKKPFCDIQQGKDVAIAVHMANKAMEEEKYQYWDRTYST
jgi:predicted dehydrogenase